MSISSVAGYISQLQDDQPEIQEIALRKLDKVVDNFWHEISTDITLIEELHENANFKHRELAALVASKVYYHLDDYQQAMSYALGAGKLFEVAQKTEYVNTLVAHFIDEYIRLRQVESKDGSAVKIDPRLEDIVLGMFERCYQEGQYKQALGVAIEIRTLDRIEEAITKSNDVLEMLSWVQKVSSQVILNREFRTKVYRLLIQIYDRQSNPDYLRICEILAFLEDSKAISDHLDRLIRSNNKDDWLLAYQIGFDLVENAAQHILLRVRNTLTSEPAASGVDSMEVDNAGPIVTEATSSKEEATDSNNNNNSSVSTVTDRKQKLSSILSGEKTIALYMDFLVRNNHTDLLILKNIKQTVESRSSVLHTATIFANAFMHCGTTIDQFLRENLEWLSRATNWAKFSAIAGLGIIHKGHMKEGLSLLGPYLPQQGSSGSAYSEGGPYLLWVLSMPTMYPTTF